MQIDFLDTIVGGFNYELIRTLNSIPSGGAELGEAIGIAVGIPDGDLAAWERQWRSAGERLAAGADEAAARGRRHTARAQWLRASNYFRSAAFYAEPASDAHRQLWRQSRDSFMRAAPLLDPPVQVVDIPFEGIELAGYYVQAASEPRPTVVVNGGFDSTLEELYHWIGAAAVERGWHCLCFEGPGQWTTRYEAGATLTPAWEHPVSAVIDWLTARPEVDPAAIALVGYSLGGYLAPRAAAHEPRLAACVANSLLINFGAVFQLPDLDDDELDAAIADTMESSVMLRWFVEHGRWAAGIESPAAMFRFFRTFDLTGLGSKITCPLLNVVGEDELGRQVRAPALDFLADVPRASSHLFRRDQDGLAASHCQAATMRRAQEVTLDWLEDVLEGRDLPPAIPGDLRERMAAVEANRPEVDLLTMIRALAGTQPQG